jgi:Protein of unknown function (DUF2004)
MPNLQTKLFGLIEFDEQNATLWHGTIAVGNGSRAISLYIGEGFATRIDELMQVFEMLEGIESFHTRAHAAFLEDFMGSKSGVVVGFIDCHLKEIDDDLLKRIFAGIDLSSVNHESLLTRLELRAIGIHLEKLSTISVNLDYCFNPEFSDELLVARFRKGGQELSLAHES